MSEDGVIKLFKEALAWGKVYGPLLNKEQWFEMLEKQANQFSERLREVNENDNN